MIAHELLACKFCVVLWGSIGDVIPAACPRCDKASWIRTPDDSRDTNWTKATAPSLELLSLILLIVGEFVQLTGRYPTVTELSHAVRHPGS